MAGKRRLKTSKPPAPRAPAAKRPPKRPAKGPRWGYALGVLALALCAVAVASVGAYLLTARHGAGRAVRVTIPDDADGAAITRALWEARVIDRPWLFHALVVLSGTPSRVHHGVVALRDDLTPRAVLRALRSGAAGVVRVTFPEAFTRFDMARRLELAGVCGAEEFLRYTEDPAVLARHGVAAVPGAPASLEGWLFPDTYDFPPDAGAEAVVARMTQVFARRLDALKVAHPDGVLRAAALVAALPAEARAALPGDGVAADPVDRAVVTLASLVERETGAPEDRPHVSSVFWNRLTRGEFTPRLLQSDPTVAYGCRVMLRAGSPEALRVCGDGDAGARRAITAAMLADATNPWNTYRHEALPPSPICNPGARALEAALAPSADEDLYFVARGDGRSVFARTLEEHRRNVQVHLRRLPRDP